MEIICYEVVHTTSHEVEVLAYYLLTYPDSSWSILAVFKAVVSVVVAFAFAVIAIIATVVLIAFIAFNVHRDRAGNQHRCHRRNYTGG
jgi:hypothetical protein